MRSQRRLQLRLLCARLRLALDPRGIRFRLCAMAQDHREATLPAHASIPPFANASFTMADRPILFSAPMVRALLAGTKTQTRRVFSSRNTAIWFRGAWENLDFNDAFIDAGPSPIGNPGPYLNVARPCDDTRHRVYPLMQPDDRLWVRETWKPHSIYADMKPREMPKTNIFFKADDGYAPSNTRWIPGIHMPRWASRLTLTVTDVRVQQLQEINEEDARTEGCPYPVEWSGRFVDRDETAKTWFKSLWNHINGPGSWDANPWVVAYTFTDERKNIDG